MRLRARETKPSVVVERDSVRPVRLRTNGLTFCMDTAEALDLANQLADAVEQFNIEERNTP